MVRRLVVRLASITVAAAAGLTPVTGGDAAVVNCVGIGVIGSIQYGTCNTDEHGGSGSVRFAHNPLTATLIAAGGSAAEQVAGFWESNGPVDVAGGEICVTVRVTNFTAKGGATSEQRLDLSYDFTPHPQVFPTTKGTSRLCGAVPTGAKNVFWQLLTTVEATGGGSRARLKETLVGVS